MSGKEQSGRGEERKARVGDQGLELIGTGLRRFRIFNNGHGDSLSLACAAEVSNQVRELPADVSFDNFLTTLRTDAGRGTDSITISLPLSQKS